MAPKRPGDTPDELKTVFTEAAAGVSPGSRLGPYEVIDLLGAGGMGQVFRARDTRIGRLVAVKVLPGLLAADHDRVRRFEQEARAAATLNHPNILTLHDVGTARHDGIESPYLVTELLEGSTLRELLRPRQPLELGTAIDYAIQLARGLAAAHAASIVHRDLKPENLFVTRDGTLKILDFGLAKLTSPDSRLETSATGTGVILGTVGYMAPEQVRAQAVDHRADLFAFGAVLYELLAGRRAFDRDSAVETLSAILHADVDPLPSSVPPPLSAMVLQSLEKDPARRPASAKDIAEALQAMRDGKVSAAPIPVPAVVRSDARKAVALSIVALALAAAAALGFWNWRSSHAAASNDLALRRVVAVLPFHNIAPDASQEYFASGMTEEIMSHLSRLSSLRVMSRPAVERYTGANGNLRRIGPELGVGSLVTGSVRLAGARVRIDVQLVDARSDESIWSQQYDRDLKDVFEVQSDVARRIAAALEAALSPAEAAHLGKPPTTDVSAYQLFLRADALSSNGREDNARGIALLRQAIAIDPRFAGAHAALARRLGWLVDFGDRAQYANALGEAQQAVTLDPSLSEAHHALAITYARRGHVGDARLSFLRAAELDPNASAVFADLSVAETWVGHFDQALYWARRMFVIAPNVPYAYYHVGIPLLLLADDARTERWLVEAERRVPKYQRVQLLLSSLDCLRGRRDAALARARRAVASRPEDQEGLNMLPEFALLAGAPDAGSLIQVRYTAAPEARTQGTLPETFRLLQAHERLKAGDAAGAEALMDKALDVSHREIANGSEFPEERIEIAAVHAMRGENAEALHWLQEAYRVGWRLYRETGSDPLFTSLRNHPEFRDLLRRMERDVAVMRERAKGDDLPQMPPLPGA